MSAIAAAAMLMVGGHILLPGRVHSRDGIMQADYNVHFSYSLKFSAEEAAAMRRFIAAAVHRD